MSLIASFSPQGWRASIWENAAYYAKKTAQRVFAIPSSACKRISDLYGFIFPINLATKKREFGNLPTCVDTFLGTILSPIISYKEELQDGAIRFRIQKIVDRICLNIQPSFTCQKPISILDLNQMNAFTAFGGKICFDKKLIDKIENLDLPKEGGVTKEDVLAALAGHEVAHAAIGHLRKRIARIIFFTFLFVLLNFYITIYTSLLFHCTAKLVSTAVFFFFALAHHRKSEYEADKYGIELMHKAGYDVRASLVLQSILLGNRDSSHLEDSWPEKVKECFSTHPSHANRRKANVKSIQEIGRSHAPSE